MTTITNLELPKQVTEVTDKLNEYGYSAYIHGECARLLIKSQSVKEQPQSDKAETHVMFQNRVAFDYDVMTDAEIPRVRAIFEGYHVIEARLEQGELTVTVLGMAISITTYSDLEYSLAAESAFTFDAIAYSNTKGFFDPFGGVADLSNNLLNFTLTGKDFNPADIFPALAWQASGEFSLSGKAKQLVTENANAAVLVRDDFEKLLLGRNAGAVLNEYSELFLAAIPELRQMLEITWEGEPYPTSGQPILLERAFKCVGLSSPVLTLRYALLFYETGKPDCHSQSSDGKDFFYGHAERSRIYARRAMTRLGCAPEIIEETGNIIIHAADIAVSEATQETLPDLRDEYPDILKQLLLFNCTVQRAASNEKEAMKFKKLSKM